MHSHSNIQQLTDSEFLSQFENQTLSPIYFKHIGHLRLTWLYLNSNDVETAVNLVSSGIQAYAESLGATTKFHRTITDAIVRIMAKRVDAMDEKAWDLFLAENNDLVDDALSVLYQYFSKDRLFSEEARRSLIQPDIKPL